MRAITPHQRVAPLHLTYEHQIVGQSPRSVTFGFFTKGSFHLHVPCSSDSTALARSIHERPSPDHSLSAISGHTSSSSRASGTVGSEEAPTEGLASVRRPNWACSFPAPSFHEWVRAIRREGMRPIRLTSLNSVRSRLVGYSFHAVFRHRRARCEYSLRTIH